MMKVRLLVAALAAAGALLLGSAPAGAVQTTTWGIMAAPNGNNDRASIDHPADGRTVHDAVLVYNRSGQRLTINLSVIGASDTGGTYQFTNARTGLAAETTLAQSSVTLAPHQAVRVGVTIRTPRAAKTPVLAAIAAESAPVNSGALVVQQRLVVFVRALPSRHVMPIVGHQPWLWAGLALLVLLGVAGLAGREWWRRSGRSSAVAPAVAVPAGG